ncbi:MAG: hypothetical protein HKN29_09410, partial [Rhodothermales bacterium]|nr:hypothetical protein [Rhodothermales bacterium]
MNWRKVFLITGFLAAGGLIWSSWPADSRISSSLIAAQEAALTADRGLPVQPAPPDDGTAHNGLPEGVSVGPRASFSVQVKDLVVPYPVMALFVLPSEEIELETIFERPGAEYRLLVEAGEVSESEEGRWLWTAPSEPGFYPLVIEGPVDTVRLHVFVQQPFRNGELVHNGYRIGAYQS